MMRIAVIGLREKPAVHRFCDGLQALEQKLPVSFTPILYTYGEEAPYDTLTGETCAVSDFDAAVSVGGDGTFLYTARIFAGCDAPVLGLNLGTLGFNASTELAQFEPVLTSLVQGTASYEYKSLLEVTVAGDTNSYSVINEGVISHAGISRMLRLKVFIDDVSLCDFSGDGLIIGSPTGSTAYNLSAGGPILHPSLDAFVLCPICPHTLAIRPYIVPFDEIITIRVEDSRVNPQLTLDGQKIVMLSVGQAVRFAKSERQVKVVKGDRSFSEILKQKLGWTV
jgi:NAD+ kinase